MRGCKRFLERVAALPEKAKGHGVTPSLEAAFHRTVKKVSSDIEEMKFNTAIAAMMSLLNDIEAAGTLTLDELSVLVRLLCPFAPHLCEEIYEKIGGKGFCSLSPWPVYDESKTVSDTVEIALQLNGKLRGVIKVAKNATREELLEAAKADERMAAALAGKTVLKEIVVPGRIVNLVVR